MATPASSAELGPMRVPSDYYARLAQAERGNPWERGMRGISAALLGERLQRTRRLLDAGCGTGGFLRWALDRAPLASVCGTDISEEALELARRHVPEGEFRVAALRELPFESASFDLVTLNDVLQHVPEADLEESVAELRRVVAPAGAVLVRTNGARRLRRGAEDWRAYDALALRATLERSGLRCVRLTYANLVGSLWALCRGRSPRAPSELADGIPAPRAGIGAELVAAILQAEARYLGRAPRRLPYGHTLFAVATPS